MVQIPIFDKKFLSFAERMTGIISVIAREKKPTWSSKMIKNILFIKKKRYQMPSNTCTIGNIKVRFFKEHTWKKPSHLKICKNDYINSQLYWDDMIFLILWHGNFVKFSKIKLLNRLPNLDLADFPNDHNWWNRCFLRLIKNTRL